MFLKSIKENELINTINKSKNEKSTDINDVTSLGRYDICCKTINLYFLLIFTNWCFSGQHEK